MRILGIYQHPEHVCFRYRLRAFRHYLEQAGHEVRFRGWPRWCMFEGRLYREARAADVVIVQRRLLAEHRLAGLRRAARMLAFDFDDAVFLRDSFDPRGLECDRRRRAFAHMVQAADIVVAGNTYLRHQALEWTDDVHMVPTCLDFTKYAPAPHSANTHSANTHVANEPTTKLVWIGSGSTLRGLERISSWLDGAAQAVPGLELKVICDRGLALARLPVRFCPWSEATEAQELTGADIGISWLPPDDWSRGKCGLKILQYMAAGLPVVANPVGVQAELVRHGETGFLARTADEWRAAISRLARDGELRRRMGGKGRLIVEKDYHVTVGATAWLEALKQLHRPRAAALRLA